MAQALTSEDVQQAWSALVQEVRTAMLLTMRNGRPFGSHVPMCLERTGLEYICTSADWRFIRSICWLILMCRCSSPNRTDPEKSSGVEADESSRGGGTAVIRCAVISGLKEQYLSRFPQAEMMFGFGDFALWELRLEDAHFVLGFGQAFVSTATTPARWVHQKVERPARGETDRRKSSAR